MQLTKANIKHIKPRAGLTVPDEQLFALPEKVLQFGTGVLLRGLPDYFIDKANRNGLFNGRIVMIKSTSAGGTDAFEKQDGLYSLCVRGTENGKKVDETIINSSISRVISANENWDSVLACAANPELQIIISNTTEVGITLVQDDIRLYPPLSFPGKLLSFLYERYKIFKGTPASGMVIIPTELIIDNGTRLRSIVLELAAMNRLERPFMEWITHSNDFCNSLVDRIVPGRLSDNDLYITEKGLGYKDELMIMAESFRLWAIESSSDRVREILSFSKADDSVVIAPDIEKFRELKLRLLNGTHTFSCGLAFLAGFSTVRESMGSQHMATFISNIATQEIVPAITGEQISEAEAISFAEKTMDRFRNPFLDHHWANICLQYSSKMKLRNVPLLLKHYERFHSVPELMAMGFAAYILFMKPARKNGETYEGQSNGRYYELKDEHAAKLAGLWEIHGPDNIVPALLSDTAFWGTDLSILEGFSETVHTHLVSMMKTGVMSVIRRIRHNKIVI